MANTFKKIQTVTVGSGGAANIEFTSIPQTYTDLKLVVSARGTAAFGSSGNFYTIRPNGLNTNLSSRYLLGIGTSASSGTYQPYGYMAASDYTASVFGNNEHYIPNYTSANYKSFSTDSVNETNASTVYGLVLDAGLWSSTSAITSITLVPGGGNFAEYSSATLYGVSNINLGSITSSPYATGGTVTSNGQYYIHTFTSDGTFTPSQTLSCEYLVIAGGASGGTNNGAGAGAGGYRTGTLSVTSGAKTVTVGGGGAAKATNGQGNDGSNSVFDSITSTGGGGGGTFAGTNAGSNGRTGGSGGGGAANDTGGGDGGAPTSGQGFAGGNADHSQSSAGGGGAGAVGGNTTGTYLAGAGGAGLASSINGTTTFRGGGGGGGVNAGGGQPAGAGGNGGGGAGGAGVAGVAGTVNTGGGGGGAWGSPSGAGGSGIVIVRYTV
jgi:hypothetical protein